MEASQNPSSLFLIAGSGDYPRLVIDGARKAGVQRIVMAAFEGETNEALAGMVDVVQWMRVGQMGRLIDAAKKSGASRSLMAGQIAPGHLFNLRPDFKALVLLAKLRQRNAETLFGAVAAELDKAGAGLISATTFLEDHLATLGLIAGPKLKPRYLADLEYGFSIAKETSRLDIGQTVLVKNGTILAVEAFEGTNEAIRRGGVLGRGSATLVKVSKPEQDMRFDVPVIGTRTLEVASEAGVTTIGVEAGATLLLDRVKVCAAATHLGISLYGQ